MHLDKKLIIIAVSSAIVGGIIGGAIGGAIGSFSGGRDGIREGIYERKGGQRMMGYNNRPYMYANDGRVNAPYQNTHASSTNASTSNVR